MKFDKYFRRIFFQIIALLLIPLFVASASAESTSSFCDKSDFMNLPAGTQKRL